MYRTHATINCGYYYFFLKLHVGFSLMIGGIPLEMCGLKTRAVINRARLIFARVRYVTIHTKWAGSNPMQYMLTDFSCIGYFICL